MKTKLLLIFFFINALFAVGQSSFKLSPGPNPLSVYSTSDVRGFILLSLHGIGNIGYYKITKFDYYGNELWDKYIADFPYYYLPGDTDIRITTINPSLSESQNGHLFSSYIDSSVVIHDSVGNYFFYWDSLQFIKLDPAGNFLWRKFYDFPVTYPYHLNTLEDASGCFLAMSQYYLLKTDSLGNALWCVNIQDTTKEAFHSFDVTTSKQIVIAGTDSINPYLLKLDENGNFLIARHFSVGLNKKIISVIANNDGYSLLLNNGTGNACALLIKTDTLLNVIWSETLGIDSTSTCFALMKDINNNSIVDILYTLAAPPQSGHYSYRSALCKLNASGALLKINCSLYDSVDCAACFVRNETSQYDIKPDADNGYLYLKRFSHSDSHFPWFSYLYNFLEKDDDISDSCFSCEVPSIIINSVNVSSSLITKNIFKWYPAFFGQSVNLIDVNYTYSVSCLEYVGISEVNPQVTSLVIFPNPTSGIFTVKSSMPGINNIDIFNLLGERIFSKSSPETTIFELRNHAAGMYFVKITIEEKVFIQKLIIH